MQNTQDTVSYKKCCCCIFLMSDVNTEIQPPVYWGGGINLRVVSQNLYKPNKTKKVPNLCLFYLYEALVNFQWGKSFLSHFIYWEFLLFAAFSMYSSTFPFCESPFHSFLTSPHLANVLSTHVPRANQSSEEQWYLKMCHSDIQTCTCATQHLPITTLSPLRSRCMLVLLHHQQCLHCRGFYLSLVTKVLICCNLNKHRYTYLVAETEGCVWERTEEEDTWLTTERMNLRKCL